MRRVLGSAVAAVFCAGLVWGCGGSTEPVKMTDKNPFEGKKGMMPPAERSPPKKFKRSSVDKPSLPPQ
jgi:hypothetical protein